MMPVCYISRCCRHYQRCPVDSIPECRELRRVELYIAVSLPVDNHEVFTVVKQSSAAVPVNRKMSMSPFMSAAAASNW